MGKVKKAKPVSFAEVLSALKDLYDHEGDEPIINGIGIECDSQALEQAKRKAKEIIDRATL